MGMGVYEKLGVRRVINASGTMTHLGGSIPDPKVMDAMKEASQSFVIMAELLLKSGEYIAEVTGAEAGLVTSGSHGALVLGAAACMMRGSGLEKFEIHPVERLNLDGEWREIIQRLPDTSWTRNEFIIQKAHRNPYDHAFKAAGGKLVVIGTEDKCTEEDLRDTITEKTAAIAFTARREDVGLPLKRIVEIAHEYDVPVIVDAADELPPRANLGRFIAEGADLVAFSGGKHIGGPNDTGILCGRRDLIKLAMLQSSPYRGIGRGMKVDRTQIMGLITALRLWLERDEEDEFKEWERKAEWISKELEKVPKILSSKVVRDVRRKRVQVHIAIDERKDCTAVDIVFNLRKGDPSIWVNYLGSNEIGINPTMLKDGEEKMVVSSIRKILTSSISTS